MSDNVLSKALDAISSRIFSGFNIIESTKAIFRLTNIVFLRLERLNVLQKPKSKQKEGKKVYV